MKNHRLQKVYSWLFALLLLSGMGACQQMSEDDWEEVELAQHPLKIQARANGGELIDYPLYLYAFGADGTLKAKQEITDAQQAIQLHLAPGDYQITAISGVSEGYKLPENIHTDGRIEMASGGYSTKPMMMGRADVTIDSKKQSSLNLSLSYAVSAVTVTLTGIEPDVKKVSLKMSPLNSALSMSGAYASEGSMVEIPCERAEGQKWHSKTVYVFPGSGSETVLSILMQKENQNESTYSYVFAGKPLANRPFVLNGSYTGDIAVGGELIAQNWGEPITVNFDFGSQTDKDQPVAPEGSDMSYVDKLPEAGTIWNHTLVGLVTPITDSEADVVLLSLDEWNQPISMAEQVKSGYSVNGISNWRHLTWEEAKKIQTQWCNGALFDINNRITAYDSELFPLDTNDRYLCDREGKYYSFVIESANAPSVAGEKRSYLIRLAKTYRLKVKE